MSSEDEKEGRERKRREVKDGRERKRIIREGIR